VEVQPSEKAEPNLFKLALDIRQLVAVFGLLNAALYFVACRIKR
jgi:hypothetical protein